jgi:Ethanolamine utilization protein EutJ (predicted chaperonin)
LDKWRRGVALPPHAEGMQLFAVFFIGVRCKKDQRWSLFHSEIKINIWQTKLGIIITFHRHI